MTWTCHYHDQLRAVSIREHGFRIATVEDATADSLEDRLSRGRMMAAAPELMEACRLAYYAALKRDGEPGPGLRINAEAFSALKVALEEAGDFREEGER